MQSVNRKGRYMAISWRLGLNSINVWSILLSLIKIGWEMIEPERLRCGDAIMTSRYIFSTNVWSILWSHIKIECKMIELFISINMLFCMKLVNPLYKLRCCCHHYLRRSSLLTCHQSLGLIKIRWEMISISKVNKCKHANMSKTNELFSCCWCHDDVINIRNLCVHSFLER